MIEKTFGSSAGKAFGFTPKRSSIARRRWPDFTAGLLRLSAWSVALLLVAIFVALISRGADRLSWSFLNSYPSRHALKAGVKAALWGSVWVMSLTTLISVPLGVAAAIYLEEFAPRNKLIRFVRLNISNLAGVPSIIFGILGLAVFSRGLGLGRSVLAGAMILSVMSLPAIIISTQEALAAVSQSLRLAAMGMGATRWQTVRYHVLPQAASTILTGVLLTISRIAGETAPLLMIGAMVYVTYVPSSVMDSFTVLPIQIFNWASQPQEDFQGTAAAGILVLLGILLSIQAMALILRYRHLRKIR